MDRTSYPWGKDRPKDGINPRLAAFVAVVVIAAAAIAVLFPRS
jgi:hypothetical protein